MRLWLSLVGALALAASPALAKPAAERPYPAAERSLRVPVEGGSIYVRINGKLNSGKLPILFIHGGPGGTFDGYLEALPLARERAVILYDQLDTGYSDRPNDPKNWRVARFVDEIEAIRKALKIERWHVAGGSWGGTLALEYGALRLPSTASVTIMSPLVSTRSWIADADALRLTLPADTQTTLTACESPNPPPATTCDAATAVYYRHFVRRSDPSPRQIAQRKARGAKTGGTALYMGMWGPSEFRATGLLKDYDGEALLANLDGTRTLFLAGQYDEARPQTVGAFAARVPGAQFGVIPGAAHSLMGDRPVETLALIRAFIERNDKP